MHYPYIDVFKIMLNWLKILNLEIQSLATLRIGVALVALLSIFPTQNIISGIDSSSAIVQSEFLQPLHFFDALANQSSPLVSYLLIISLVFASVVLLLGYKSRLATILSFCLCSIAYVWGIGQFPSTGQVLIPTLLWSMFLPLGAAYSLDNAMNLAKPIANSFLSSATVALIIQQCFNYWMPESPFVFGVANFDWQSASSAGLFTLIFKLGPILLFIPFQNVCCRLIAIIGFSTLHLVATLFFGQSALVLLLAVVTWCAFLPRTIWKRLEQFIDSPQKRGLIIYYDADCGFCKKVVHVLRTLLILPGTPLITAQSDASICEDMQTYNSWVVVDWQKNRHFKFEAIAYICSLSPIFYIITPILKSSPIMALGNQFYEMVANNRRKAGFFTRFLKFNDITEANYPKIIDYLILALLTLYILVYVLYFLQFK